MARYFKGQGCSLALFGIKCLSIFVLTTFVIYGCKQPNSSDSRISLAKIQFAVSELELGEMDADSPKTNKEFVFYNVGKEPLIIHNIETSCHCTTVSFPNKPIAPGDSGSIAVEMDATDITGNFWRTLTIHSNSSEGTSVVTIHGIVEIK